MKAIIIDDEPYCCEVLVTLLHTHCPHVQVTASFNSGVEALMAIQLNPPDIVFLDVEMPIMNGFLAANSIICNGTFQVIICQL